MERRRGAFVHETDAEGRGGANHEGSFEFGYEGEGS